VADGETARVVVLLPDGGSVRGRVLDPSGRFLAAGSAQVLRPENYRSVVRDSTPGASGGYQVLGLTPGEYILQACSDPKRHPESMGWRAVPKPIRVVEGDCLTVDLEFTEGPPKK